MAKLAWDVLSTRTYETGVKKGVIYPVKEDGNYDKGVAWSGLTAYNESPSGADATALWADDIKYLELRSTEELGATIEAYTYPDEFALCDGTAELAPGITIGQQPRKKFGFVCQTTVGNDVQLDQYGYKLHILYGAMASPSEKSYQTINDSPDAITFSWELTTTPVEVAGHKPTANVTIDSTKLSASGKAKLKELEDILFGTDGTYTEFSGSSFAEGTTYYEKLGTSYVATSDTEKDADKTYYTATGGTDPRLPMPEEIAAIFAA